MPEHNSKLTQASDQLQKLKAGFSQTEAKTGVGMTSYSSDEALYRLMQVTEHLVSATQAIRRDGGDDSDRLNTLEAKLEYIQREIVSLCKVVRDGNGQPSILQRQANMETTLVSYGKNLEQLSQYANSINASRMLTKSQLVAGLGGMIFTALLAGLALIASFYKPG